METWIEVKEKFGYRGEEIIEHIWERLTEMEARIEAIERKHERSLLIDPGSLVGFTLKEGKGKEEK